jgi:hypothetical protein
MSWIFKFYLSAMPSLPPCYFVRIPFCQFLFWSFSLLQEHLERARGAEKRGEKERKVTGK